MVCVYIPVEMSPCELRTNESLRLERLHCLDDMQVGNCGQFRVFWEVEVLFGHHNTLLEEVLIDGIAMLLWHEHAIENQSEREIKRCSPISH